MKNKIIATMLIVLVVFLFALPVGAQQDSIDIDKIAKEAEKILKKTYVEGPMSVPNTADIYPEEPDKDKGEVSTNNQIGNLGYGQSYVDLSPFNTIWSWCSTYAWNPQPYVYVKSWFYKNSTCLSVLEKSRYYTYEVKVYHPEGFLGGRGTQWCCKGYHYISTGGTLSGFCYTEEYYLE